MHLSICSPRPPTPHLSTAELKRAVARTNLRGGEESMFLYERVESPRMFPSCSRAAVELHASSRSSSVINQSANQCPPKYISSSRIYAIILTGADI